MSIFVLQYYNVITKIVLGECICKDGYGASDCSYDLSIPPDLYSIDIGSGDICDIKNCEEVFIEGDGFLKTSTLSCRLQQFYVSYLWKLFIFKVYA